MSKKRIRLGDRVDLMPGKAGYVIRFPNQLHRRLRAEGEPVRVNAFWMALLKDGSVKPVPKKKTAAKGKK